ncbi:MAG: PEP/pyruvate-binding domain-containing protein [Planctomycetota bacterium]|nr:PEP/pyruvate-binding domain-containing protein [Planctomycetota bacterium]
MSPAQGRRGRRGPPSLVLEALDIDGDGVISGEEMDEAVRSLLTLDRDGDGNLTSDELQPPRGGFGGPPRGGPGGPGGMFGGDPVVRALDKDGDGELFDDEVTDAPRSLDRLDLDDDDLLTPRELEGERGDRGRGGFGGGFGRPDRGSAAGYDGTPDPEELRVEDGRATVPDRATFRELSYQGQEVLVDTHLADQEFVKFMIEDADGAAPRLYFMNTKNHRAHPMFMQLIGVGGRGGFGRPSREQGGPVRMRGVLVYRPTLMSPSGRAGLYTFEFEPNDAYEYRMIRIAFDLLGEKSEELRGNLSYNLLPRAAQQYELDKADYDRTGLPVFRPDDVYGEVAFLPLHTAESFGRLRLMRQGERPSQRDVVIYETLPNEMPRVAGVLTAVRQTPLSHVNLRAVQDDIPNAYVLGVADDAVVQALIGRFVRYAVTASGYELREASQQEVDAHFEAMRPDAPQTPPRDLSVREVRAFAGVRFADAPAFGVKAANLATMREFGFADGRTPDGYAVPLSFYDAFMRHNGFYEMAREMVTTDDFRADPATRERALKAFRKKVKRGEMPSWMYDALTEVQGSFPQGQPIRCRSSTNNEDLPGFSGAGLYDSFTHKPDEGHLSVSVRQVFASLWNFRAYEEREFHRIDHLMAAMGVVLHPNQKREQVNGVAVTKDVLYKAQHPSTRLYFVNVQVGEDLVTNPEAASVPEELLLSPRNPRRDRVLQRSNRATDGASLLSSKHRQELRRCMRTLHDRFAQLYGRGDDDAFAIEIEFKVTEAGDLLIKQARPWID